MVAAYRWQYLAAGLREPRFAEALAAKLNTAQATRFRAALALIVGTTD